MNTTKTKKPATRNRQPATTHTHIINHMITRMEKPVRYLEIGVDDPDQNFNKIDTDQNNKLGVDPVIWQSPEMLETGDIPYPNYAGLPRPPLAGQSPKERRAVFPHYQGRIWHGPSELFWVHNKERFDVVFVDGLHHASMVFWDILNAIWVTDPGGFVFAHDLMPPDEAYQVIPRRQTQWTGNAWLAWSIFRQYIAHELKSYLSTHVFGDDYGVGMIRIRQHIPDRLKPTFEKLQSDTLSIIGPYSSFSETGGVK